MEKTFWERKFLYRVCSLKPNKPCIEFGPFCRSSLDFEEVVFMESTLHFFCQGNKMPAFSCVYSRSNGNHRGFFSLYMIFVY
jgi:hypothetical protein